MSYSRATIARRVAAVEPVGLVVDDQRPAAGLQPITSSTPVISVLAEREREPLLTPHPGRPPKPLAQLGGG